MSDPVILIDKLSKAYRIGHRAERYPTFREALVRQVQAPFRRLREGGRGATETFWALKDVSFEVQKGEVVGIIGRNGAGKSTLLKVLSRITEPTSGEVRLRGRVASLLEVGTGFHAELTGRENVYLNGAILGMKKAEIDRKFDQIVAFAEVEKFLDTPVKHYSSGMYVRLAFAVAAHLEPEILIVDEVLAVGDAEFQKRCLGKMQQVSKAEGRTVVFVSHNMSAVGTLCQSACWLDRGQVVKRGPSLECVEAYLGGVGAAEATGTVTPPRPDGAGPWMESVTLLCGGAPSSTLNMGDTLSVHVEFRSESPVQQVGIGFVISTAEGEWLINSNNQIQAPFTYPRPVTHGTVQCDLGVVPFVGRRYKLSLYLGTPTHDTHIAEDVLFFDVRERDIWGHGKVPAPRGSLLWWPTTFHIT